MRKTDLLNRFSLKEEDFLRLGLSWEELKAIEKHYEKLRPTLDTVGRTVIDHMLGSPAIHSLNYRIKSTDHVLSKVVRKRIDDSERHIHLENYRDQLTDLVGIRALHLFKEDWQGIHRYICENWDLAETPTAYVRYGDSERIIDYYRKNNCQVLEHKHGYRSVHYLLRTRPKNEDFLVEVQVRTLFEEAWGEIDHRVRYPEEDDNDLLVRLSSILNRLAGDADELGSYMRWVSAREKKRSRDHQRQIEEKNQVIERLQKQIEALAIDKQAKIDMTRDLAHLTFPKDDEEREDKDGEGDFPWLNSFLDSNLFRGIQNSLKDYMKSDSFKPLDISPEEFKMLRETQKELLGALGADPGKIHALLRQAPSPQLLLEALQAEDEKNNNRS